MQAIDKEVYRGCTIRVHHDDCPGNPREWGTNLSKIVMFHRNYCFPNDLDLCSDDYSNWDEVRDDILKENVAFINEIMMYDHSGIWISMSHRYPFNDRWDAGQVGFIFLLKRDIMKDYGVKRISKKTLHKARRVMEAEFETYAAYVSGQVYGYTAEGPNGEDIDSCWGFYGDIDEAIEYAKGEINAWLEAKIEKRVRYLKGVIRSRVPLIYRKPMAI